MYDRSLGFRGIEMWVVGNGKRMYGEDVSLEGSVEEVEMNWERDV